MFDIIVVNRRSSRVLFLKQKQLQYLRRILDPNERENTRTNAFVKLLIIQELIEHEKVTLENVKAWAVMLLGQKYDEVELKDAWNRIDDYVRTGGANTLQPLHDRVRA